MHESAKKTGNLRPFRLLLRTFLKTKKQKQTPRGHRK